MQHAFHQNTRQARSMHNCLKCWPCCLETKAGLTVKCTVVIAYRESEDLLITYFSHKHSKNAFLLSLLPFSQLNLLSQIEREPSVFQSTSNLKKLICDFMGLGGKGRPLAGKQLCITGNHRNKDCPANLTAYSLY